MRIMVHHGGQQLGPYSIDEVRAGFDAKHFLPTDLAWVEGAPSWIPLSTLLMSVPGSGVPASPGVYPPTGYAVVSAPSTELALTSLILGILAFFFCFTFLAGIPAIICGHMARTRVQRAPGQFGGAGMALAGLILGYLSLLPLLALPFVFLVPVLAGRAEVAKTTAAHAQISAFSAALDAYEIDTESYPSSSEGLKVLVAQPANHPGWKGPYLNEIPQDPWGHGYVYRRPAKEPPKPFDIISGGPDGRIGTADDIRNEDEGFGGNGKLKEEE